MKLEGKSIIFTDIHFGLKNNSLQRLNICCMVIKNIAQYAKKNKISNIIFCGDFFHQRTAIDVHTMNIANRCLHLLAKVCKVHLIVGNHDIFNDKTTDINSLEMFKSIKNVVVYTESEEVEINGQPCLFMPWLSQAAPYTKNNYSALFGHFDSNPKYFETDSYVESNNVKTEVTNEITEQLLSCDILNDNTEIESIPKVKKESIGDFIDLLKDGGLLFSGHIHQHREYITKGKHFIYVGSPYQQTFNEVDSKDGFYILNEDFSYEFYEIPNIPRFTKLYISEIIKHGIDKFNFKKYSNQIIKKIYDVEIDAANDYEITKKLNETKPYEELTPDYEIKILENDIVAKESIDSIRKSKKDYLINFLDNIEDTTLKDRNIKRDKLTDLMISVYNRASNNELI